MNILSIVYAVFFLLIGICIERFKLYWLIAGYNTSDKKTKKNIDIEKYGKLFGYAFYLDFIISIIVFGLSYLITVPFWILNIMVFGVISGMIIYGSKYNKNVGARAESIAVAVILLIVIAITSLVGIN